MVETYQTLTTNEVFELVREACYNCDLDLSYLKNN